MPYRLIEFDGVRLPEAMPIEDLGTGQVESTLRDSVGGVFDYYGDRRRTVRRHQFRHQGKYEGQVDTRVTSNGNRRVTDSGNVRVTAPNALRDLQIKTAALKSRIGNRGKLWRRSIDQGTRTWKLCKLLEVAHEEEIDTALRVAPVTATFQTDQAGWRSEDAVSTSDSFVDGTFGTLIVPNGGGLTVHDAVLTMQVTSGTVTRIAVSWLGGGINFSWFGTANNGTSLIIDAGRQTVRRGNGADAWSGFNLNAPHSARGWLPLPPGDSPISVIVDGGNADVTIEHFDQDP